MMTAKVKWGEDFAIFDLGVCSLCKKGGKIHQTNRAWDGEEVATFVFQQRLKTLYLDDQSQQCYLCFDCIMKLDMPKAKNIQERSWEDKNA